MLTRLKVKGFKNLLDVDVRFGPFTCIAGPNGVGKSNLFDAILFLSALSEKTLHEAACSVRDEAGKKADVRNIFFQSGKVFCNEISIYAEMIIPSRGIDDLGQMAEASTTFVSYGITIKYRGNGNGLTGGLELVREEMSYLKKGDAKKHLLFEKNARWIQTAIKGRRTEPFISTDENGNIKLHQDRGESGGRPRPYLASTLPRTVLSNVNTHEHRTALLTKREMQSWKLLLLEPSALRHPDEFDAPKKMSSDGLHMPATLCRLAEKESDRIYSTLANKVSELVEDVRDIKVDRDEKRQLYSIEITDKEGTTHPARSMSDGTLRFLALAVLEMDTDSPGVICLEEPENGIHPKRIAKMIQLLEDMVTDVKEEIDVDNPLRQVIVNTHSPIVVNEIEDDALFVAELYETIYSGHPVPAVRFCCLSDTWRAGNNICIAKKGDLLAYLTPIRRKKLDDGNRRRLADRDDMKPYLPFKEPL